MAPSSVSIDPLADDPFLTALRSAGATSRGDAVRRSDLPEVGEDMLAAFVAADLIGCTDDERYYLVARPVARKVPTTFTPRSVALMTAFWVFALLAPLIIWLLAR